MKYLLDTCVISELVKKKSNNNVIRWLESADDDSLFLSILTIGEIQKGISKLPDSNKKTFIQNWLDNDLINRFSNRIIDINIEIINIWGILIGKSESKGISIPTIDSLIGATAIAQNMTVITRNIRDIEKTGAKTLNIWN